MNETQDLIRDELQSSFKQRAEQTVQRKQQELEEQLFKRTIDAVQEVDIDSQRVSQFVSSSLSSYPGVVETVVGFLTTVLCLPLFIVF